MAEEIGGSEPLVAIFWLLAGCLILYSVPLSQAEPYGRYLNAPAHEDYWDQLCRAANVLPSLDYDEPPRGRVVYDLVEERHLFYADRCILKNAALIASVLEKLGLSSNHVEIAPDAHYRCRKCLEKASGEL